MDVVPNESGWAATCECTRRRTFDEQGDAWQWLVEHDCAVFDVPEQRSPQATDQLTPPAVAD